MTTAFVLTGGGSLGAVQVGMLQALAAHGTEPDLLVGASAGAVNALWVAEHGMSPDSLDELADIWEHLHRSDIFPVTPLHVLAALVGRDRAMCSSERLGSQVRAHARIDDIADATIPVHLVASDLLSGDDVLISSGSPSDAIRASAAIPGVFPPMWLNGHWLIDGALASHSGISQSVALGASTVYVLPAGTACALSRPPRSAVGVAAHALTLLIEQRLILDVADPPPGATVRLLPPLCPMSVSAADFSQARQLIDRAREASIHWIEEGGLEAPDPARYLSLHDHRRTPTRGGQPRA